MMHPKKGKQHGHGKHGSDINKFLDKGGWEEATIDEGQTRSDTIVILPSQNVVLFSQVFDEDGDSIHGKYRPYARVEETDTTAVIVVNAPVTEPVTFLYKVVDDDDEEENDEEEEPDLL